MHDRYKALDTEIQAWMAKQEWGVTATNLNFDYEILAWRHEEDGKPSTTLRISRQVMDDWQRGSPPIATSTLDALKVADKLRKTGNALVTRNATGIVSAKIETY
jgi:hypothetical protein